jgi:hypothetical protein
MHKDAETSFYRQGKIHSMSYVKVDVSEGRLIYSVYK